MKLEIIPRLKEILVRDLLYGLSWFYDVDLPHFRWMSARFRYHWRFLLWIDWLDLIYWVILMTKALDDTFWGTLARDGSETVLTQWKRRLPHTRPNVARSIRNSLTVGWVTVWISIVFLIFVVVDVIISLPSRYTSSRGCKPNWIDFAQVEIFSLRFTLLNILLLLSLKKWELLHSVAVHHCLFLFPLKFHNRFILCCVVLCQISFTFLRR